MATNQQNFRVRNGLTIDGSTSGSSSFANPATGSDVSFTLPGVYPASNGYVLASTTAGVLSWVANPDTNTTYNIDASTTTGGANFNLVGSDLTTDTIKFAEGSGMSVVRTDANTITFANTSPGTTYTYTASTTTGGANLTLTGSDATTNTIKLTDGTGVTNTYVSPTEVSVAIGQDVATTATPTFAGANLGNVTVGYPTDADISTTTGNLVISPATGSVLYLVGDTSNPVYAQRNTTGTTGSGRSLVLLTNTSSTPAVGFGSALEWQVETGANVFKRAGLAEVVSTDITTGSEDFRMNFYLMANGATYTNKLSIFSNGDIDMSAGGKFAIKGATNGYTQFAAPTTGSNITYTLPSAYPASNGYVLSSTTGGTMSWVAQSGGGSSTTDFTPSFLLGGM